MNGNPFLTEHGPRPHYYADVQAILPGLEILDGVNYLIFFNILNLFWNLVSILPHPPTLYWVF